MKRTLNNSADIKDRRLSYKRPLDLTILISSHVVLLPLWFLLWTLIPLLIWLGDRGPVFFRQERLGKDGRAFVLLKFRTMTVDGNTKGPVWTTEKDNRITPIGKILRRTAMDELPGLISIWKGDMSFVGPRALETSEHHLLETQIPGFRARLQVAPGLTGLAQVRDKFDVAKDKLMYDLEYIAYMNLWLDINLLLVSVKNTFLARWDRRSGKSELKYLQDSDDSND